MKPRKIALLSAIAALSLVIGIRIVTDRAGGKKNLGLDFDAERIEVSRANGETLVFEKKDDSWFVSGAKGNTAKIDGLAANLREAKILGKVAPFREAERFGLDGANAITVTVSAPGKESFVLKVGKESPTARQAYCQVGNSGDIVLVSGSLKTAFTGTAQDFREVEPEVEPATAPAPALEPAN